MLRKVLQGCGWNPCWRRPHQPRRFDEEDQVMLSMKSSSSCLSLTEKQVQQCKEELKAYYHMSRRKVTVDPLNFMERVELDEIYTNLSLIDKSSMRSTPVTYDDLLSSDENGNLSKRLLVQGEGGAGKTTLCAKIAWDWCQGRILQDLDMVLVIPLRDVTDVKSIGDIVKSHLSDSNTAMTNQIDDYISKNLNKIVLIFDGFDEFNGKLNEKNSSEIVRILECEQYKSCKVIVTTRPWRTNEFRMEKSLAEAYTFITVEGFNKENLSTYIRRYFLIREKDALAENLISFMEENDVIRSNMAPFPIYCAMLCLMWNDFSEERRKEMQKLKTFSKIFGEMISFLKEHYASKICDNSHIHNAVAHLKEADRAIQDISEIALNGLFDRNLSFPEEQFSECRVAMETCCRVGVLTIARDVISRKRRRDVNVPSYVVSTVLFPHKLFQEYVAGLYVADVYANDITEYDQLKDKLLPRFEEFRYLFYFSSSLGSELGLDIIKSLINSADQYFCVDAAFECYNEKAIRAVGERWEEYELSSYMSEHTKAGVVFMVYSNQVLSLFIDDMNCGRTMSRDLAEGMCSSSVLREVSIRFSRFHPDFYKILGEKASNCQIQCLKMTLGSWVHDSQHHFRLGGDLAQWVCTMPRLSSFSVNCDYLPDDFFSTAADLAGSSQIQNLKLWLCDNSQHHSSMGEALARWVHTMPSLSSFSMDCSSFPDNFLSTATPLAQSCMIRELHVCFHDGWVSEPASAVNFSQFLCSLPNLERAELKCENLPEIFFTTIASQATSCTLEGITINGKPVNELIIDNH
ncbi:baculoviral IAP repeat-containing protein 1f-like [Diadema antillarum]|uniref:baculoviral IAP repeat-containing protein 1f-like n=1 Tax=Diadema antillarum TaxID=105358 RepID=UPI003A842207